MKKVILLVMLLSITIINAQQTSSFIPKEGAGRFIYALVGYAGNEPMRSGTSIAIQWGSFNKSKAFTPSAYMYSPGIMIQLGYKGGSQQINVQTNGNYIQFIQANEKPRGTNKIYDMFVFERW